MIPEPLHPAIVHFPIVLAVFLPFLALGAWLLIGREKRPQGSWAWVIVFAALLAGSAWVAVETGESQEDRVEEVVPRNALHSHEEAGERFLVLSAALVLLSAVGLAPGKLGRGGQVATVVAAFGLLAAGVNVGASGGDLVYEHGAAQAYAAPAVQDRGHEPTEAHAEVEESRHEADESGG